MPVEDNQTRSISLCASRRIANLHTWQIDGKKATKENIIDLLIGPDTPGSMVTIKYQRFIDEMTCTLKRASSEELADKKRMFELL